MSVYYIQTIVKCKSVFKYSGTGSHLFFFYVNKLQLQETWSSKNHFYKTCSSVLSWAFGIVWSHWCDSKVHGWSSNSSVHLRQPLCYSYSLRCPCGKHQKIKSLCSIIPSVTLNLYSIEHFFSFLFLII